MVYQRQIFTYNKYPMEKKFEQIENEFQQLKRDFQEKRLSDEEFKVHLKKLRLTDKTGKCWTIGARTGKWYYYDGSEWIEAKPPSLQEGKAICIYCGFENNLENESCDYCGGNLAGGDYACPKCGCALISPSQDCPECDEDLIPPLAPDESEIRDPIGDSEELTDTREIFSSFGSVKETRVKKFEELDKEIAKEEKALIDDGSPNSVLRALSPTSLTLFVGISGSLGGLIFGIFVGLSRYFPAVSNNLPAFLRNSHGTIIGGILHGLAGGIVGFVALGLIGFLEAVLINVILSFFGGIKVRVDKI